MPTRTIVAHLDQPDPGILDRTLKIQKVCLACAVLPGVAALLAWAVPAVRSSLPNGLVMPVSAALVSLVCAASLATTLTSASRKRGMQLHLWLAGTAVVLGVMALGTGSATPLADLFSIAARPAEAGSMAIQVSAGFTVLGLLLFFMNAKRGVASYFADGLVLILFLLLLLLVSRYLFEALNIFDTTVLEPSRPVTLATFALLSVATFLSRAHYGSFDVLLGGGLSGRIARNLMILPFLMPFLREAGRERLLRSDLVPEHGAAAFLASASAIMLLAVLVIIARYIRRMERSIRDLSLRDELTGVYNLRGFNLLADQALRLAQRSSQPFSLLFVDVDDLKQINDNLGHGVGSNLLVGTADLIKASFRETDVVGRIGGDEFAVAGQLTHAAIVEAAERLEAQASLTRASASDTMPISLSIGYVTAGADSEQTLDELLEKADAIMYNQKRRKKLQLC
jgi:diguanylate cyclase (GGDEF)-like protein